MADSLGELRIPLGNGTSVSVAERDWDLPTGAVAQTVPGRATSASGAQTLLATGRLTLAAIPLRAGKVIHSITFYSGNQAAVTPTNQWFCIYSAARGLLAVTADDTTTAWAVNSPKTLVLSADYTVPTSGLYYLGICVVAATPPNQVGCITNGITGALSPCISGSSTTGLTNPASAPSTAAALTALGAVPYATVNFP